MPSERRENRDRENTSGSADSAPSGVGRQVAAGAAWMVLMRAVIRSIGLVSMMILARLLVPEDFGLIALAATVVGILEVLGAFGFDVVILREFEASRAKYDTAWTLTVIRGAVVACILLLGAGAAAYFFKEPRIEPILHWLAVASFISGLQNIGVVDFRKYFDFAREFYFMVSTKLGGFVVTVTLAYLWRSYWALVAGMVATECIRVIASYVMHPYRPRYCLSEWRPIMNYSKWLMANSVLRFFQDRSDTFFIAKLAGASSVGVYTIAYEISNLALTEMVGPVQRALLPGYARFGADVARMRGAYLDAFGLMVLLALPVAAGIGVTADLLVPLFLGDGWGATVPLIQVLTVCGAVRIAGASSGPAYHALGYPHYITNMSIVTLAVALPVLYWLTLAHGALGAALAVTGAAVMFLVLNMVTLLRLLRLSFFAMMSVAWRSIAGVLAMVGAVRTFRALAASGIGELPAFVELAAAVAIGASTYVAVVLALWLLSGKPGGAEGRALDEVNLRCRRIWLRIAG